VFLLKYHNTKILSDYSNLNFDYCSLRNSAIAAANFFQVDANSGAARLLPFFQVNRHTPKINLTIF